MPEQLDDEVALPSEPPARYVPGSKVLRSLAGGRDLKRLFRYSATSVMALGISEICLVAVAAYGHVGATTAALVANVAGTVPSYLLSRYWIWAEADRRKTGRQLLLYWITSVVSWVISSFATGAIAHHVHVHHLLRLTLLGAAYLVVSLALWAAKYVAYQAFVFRTPAQSMTSAEVAD